MPRNSSGTYSLPESPFIPGTTIESTPVNNNFDDIATALTGSLPVDGSAPMTAPLELANGTESAPSLTFTNSPGTGFYRIADNVIGFAVNGTLAWNVDDDGAIEAHEGVRFGNDSIADTDTLDWYEEGTFTPSLEIGGATTGITYSSREGLFTRIGDIVNFSLVIRLSSKGSLVGDVSITGLPYTANNGSTDFACALFPFDGIDMTIAADLTIYAIVQRNTSDALVYKQTLSGDAAVQLTDSDIGNDLDLHITGMYKV